MRNTVPAEHYDLFCLKQNTNPRRILENAESIIEINTEQARHKVKLNQEHEGTSALSLVAQQNYLKTKHGIFEILELPYQNISCNICQIFQPSTDVPHLVCKAKFSKYAVLESCPLMRDKSTVQRFEMLQEKAVCLKCFLTTAHSTASCRHFKSKKDRGNSGHFSEYL